MNTYLHKLVNLGAASLSEAAPKFSTELMELAGDNASDLLDMLSSKNGFYAFESALHVFPSAAEAKELGLEVWNSTKLWRSEFSHITNGALFFAEDVFGNQFCFRNNEV